MGIRDRLAIQRSRLANERTLLSYARSSVVFLVSGITILKLFMNDKALVILAELLIISAVVTCVLGVIFYRRTKRELII